MLSPEHLFANLHSEDIYLCYLDLSTRINLPCSISNINIWNVAYLIINMLVQIRMVSGMSKANIKAMDSICFILYLTTNVRANIHQLLNSRN